MRSPVDNFSQADSDRMLAVDVHAVFVAMRAVIIYMGEGGRIITVGSVTADRSGYPGVSAYSMTKAVVAALGPAAAAALAERDGVIWNEWPLRVEPECFAELRARS